MSAKTERTLEIYEQLLRNSDSFHPINSKQIMDAINVTGDMDFGRKAVYSSMSDIRQVNDHVKNAKRKEYGWYMEHDYSEAEVLFFGNVFSKVRCVSPKAKKNVLNRLKGIIYPNARQYMDVDSNTCFVRESVSGTLDYIINIQNAIMQRRKIRFYYMTMDEYMHPIRKHGGKQYKASPYYMFFSAQTMYLFAAEDDSPTIKTYRVDRMDEVELTSEKAVSPRKYIKGNAQEELKRRAAESIDNFDGPRITVFLDAPYTPVAMNIIADRVGNNADVLQYNSNNGHCLIRINVRRSPTLTGWLMQNVGFFSVVSPQCVIDDIIEAASLNMNAYEQST